MGSMMPPAKSRPKVTLVLTFPGMQGLGDKRIQIAKIFENAGEGESPATPAQPEPRTFTRDHAY
jgi:hypothetical protein